jgi:hypothetical protein
VRFGSGCRIQAALFRFVQLSGSQLAAANSAMVRRLVDASTGL